MKLEDIFKLGLGNLLRNKGRTALTVLGVIVGCCAVVVMVSIGIGTSESEKTLLSEMGNLTAITVEASSTDSKHKLDDSAVAAIKNISNVTSVTEKQGSDSANAIIYAGNDRRYKYESAYIMGVDLSKAEEEGYQLVSGSWDDVKKGEVLIGEYFAYAFADTKRPEGSNYIDPWANYDYDASDDGSSETELESAYFDPEQMTLTLVLPTESGSSSASSSESASDSSSTASSSSDQKGITVTLKVGGILKEDYTLGEETSSGLIMDLDTWKDLLNKQARANGTTSAAKNGYSSLTVHVDQMSNVSDVEKQIKALGFQTSSMESIRKSMEESAQQKQAMLGGLGAISLFVAALGIANTMIMSISERTKEIGVMKALGCYVSDVRKLFLLEAGCIGLIGGAIGIVVSYLLSWIMNLLSASGLLSTSSELSDYMYYSSTEVTKMSIIPWWLAIFAVIFSVIVGLAAGYYPAEKAVSVPALEAIKHE